MISVLMSVYNEPLEYIVESTNSILKQTYSDLEYIIVIDDPTNREVIDFLKMLSKADNRIRLIFNESNNGLVKSLNKGLNYCNGNYIARMDADDVAIIDRLEHQLDYLVEHQLDLISGGFILFNEEGEKGTYYFPPENEKCLKVFRKHNCLPHPGWFGKREVFSLCMGYREINRCEDYDFVIRTTQIGFRVGNYPGVILKYRLNKKGISQTGLVEQKIIANYLAKNFSAGKIVSMEEYSLFKGSDEYKRLIKKEQYYVSLKDMISNSTFPKKILLLMKLLFKTNFVVRYIKGDY